MTKIWIDHEQWKGCGLCTTACPKQILKLSNHRFNQKGYHTVELIDDDACIHCGMCTIICPDCAILLKEVVQTNN